MQAPATPAAVKALKNARSSRSGLPSGSCTACSAKVPQFSGDAPQRPSRVVQQPHGEPATPAMRSERGGPHDQRHLWQAPFATLTAVAQVEGCGPGERLLPSMCCRDDGRPPGPGALSLWSNAPQGRWRLRTARRGRPPKGGAAAQNCLEPHRSRGMAARGAQQRCWLAPMARVGRQPCTMDSPPLWGQADVSYSARQSSWVPSRRHLSAPAEASGLGGVAGEAGQGLVQQHQRMANCSGLQPVLRASVAPTQAPAVSEALAPTRDRRAPRAPHRSVRVDHGGRRNRGG